MKVYVYVVFVWGTNVNTGWTDERQFNVLVVQYQIFAFCFVLIQQECLQAIFFLIVIILIRKSTLTVYMDADANLISSTFTFSQNITVLSCTEWC